MNIGVIVLLVVLSWSVLSIVVSLAVGGVTNVATKGRVWLSGRRAVIVDPGVFNYLFASEVDPRPVYCAGVRSCPLTTGLMSKVLLALPERPALSVT